MPKKKALEKKVEPKKVEAKKADPKPLDPPAKEASKPKYSEWQLRHMATRR